MKLTNAFLFGFVSFALLATAIRADPDDDDDDSREVNVRRTGGAGLFPGTNSASGGSGHFSGSNSGSGSGHFPGTNSGSSGSGIFPGSNSGSSGSGSFPGSSSTGGEGGFNPGSGSSSTGDAGFFPGSTTRDGRRQGPAYNNNNRPPYAPGPNTDIAPVAFTATRAVSHTLSAPSQVRFEDVVTNVGYGFDAYGGRFEAPSDGLYVFSWSGVAPSQSQFRLSLSLNGRQMAHSWGDTSGYQSAGNSVVLALRRGDRVSLVVSEGRIYEPTSTQTGYTTFTGYRIN